MSRPKGSKNKLTASIKGAISEAFTQLGGVPSLVRWAKEDQAAFYKLWGNLAPKEISGPGEDGELVIKIRVEEQKTGHG